MSKLVVVSLNKAKLDAVQRAFPDCEVVGVENTAHTPEQPLGEAETLAAAELRVMTCDAPFAIALEAGVVQVEERYFNSNWAVMKLHGQLYRCRAVSFEIPQDVGEALMTGNHTLQDFLPRDCDPELGFVHYITNGAVARTELYNSACQYLYKVYQKHKEG